MEKIKQEYVKLRAAWTDTERRPPAIPSFDIMRLADAIWKCAAGDRPGAPGAYSKEKEKRLRTMLRLMVLIFMPGIYL